MDERLLEFLPAFDRVTCCGLECWCLATDIDKDDITLNMSAYAVQWQVAMVDALMAVDAGSADMRRAA